jgi:hypothetical protein
MDCACLCVGLLLILQGVGFDLRRDLKPLFLEVPTKCSTKFPNQLSRCLEAKLLLLGPMAPKPLQPSPLSSLGSLFWRRHLP